MVCRQGLCDPVHVEQGMMRENAFIPAWETYSGWISCRMALCSAKLTWPKWTKWCKRASSWVSGAAAGKPMIQFFERNKAALNAGSLRLFTPKSYIVISFWKQRSIFFRSVLQNEPSSYYGEYFHKIWRFQCLVDGINKAKLGSRLFGTWHFLPYTYTKTAWPNHFPLFGSIWK